VQKSLDARDNLVGYIGVLNNTKNVMNFVKSIPNIKREGVKFLIGGDGQLRDRIEKILNDKNLNSRVKFVGWIPHQKLPDYLNELRLLVIPSYSEGLPNLMLEAMACGTPVLASPVGAIPDVIKDKKTGFILEDNTPQGIAEGIMKALDYPNLDRIVENARELVEKEFNFGVAVKQYQKVLKEIVG
jgi:glycosyltransferase involved in cell wall biosynthesis